MADATIFRSPRITFPAFLDQAPVSLRSLSHRDWLVFVSLEQAFWLPAMKSPALVVDPLSSFRLGCRWLVRSVDGAPEPGPLLLPGQGCGP